MLGEVRAQRAADPRPLGAAREAVAGEQILLALDRLRAGGLNQEDAWQRSVEFLFERLAVSWTIAGAEPIERQKELLARFRFATVDERTWIRGVLREHLAANFPDVEAP